MYSTLLNKNHKELCEFSVNSFVEKQSTYLTNRLSFAIKLRKEILRLDVSYENNSIEKTKLSKVANKFHQNVKRLIAKEKFEFKTYDFKKENSDFFLIADKLLFVNNIRNKNDNDKKNYLDEFYFKQKLPELLFDEINVTNSIISENYLKLYKAIIDFNSKCHIKIISDNSDEIGSVKKDELDVEIISAEVISSIKQFKNNLRNRFDKKLQELIENYTTSFKEAENSKKTLKKFSEKSVESFEKELNKKYKDKTQSHIEYFTGLFGNWNFFEDISSLNYFVLFNFFEIRDTLTKKIKTEIFDEFNNIINVFALVKLELEQHKESETFLKYLKSKKEEVQNQLEDDLLIKIVRLLPYDNPAPIIKAYLGKVKTAISSLPQQRTITNLDNLRYNEKNKLYTFSSKEIIENNIYNSAFSKLTDLSKQARINVKNLSAEVLGLGQISNYNFETAISVGLHEDEEINNSNENSAYEIAIEGTDRIIAKCKSVSNQFSEIFTSAFDEFHSSVKKFSENLYKLNTSDELIQLKHKLSREKSKEEAQEKIEEVKTNIKNFFPYIFTKSKNLYLASKEKFSKITEKVGLTNVPKEVSEEILDYIVETEKQIESLPFIYQRLFKNTPVNDRRFFIGREEEHEKILKAYKHWENGKFAPMVVVSEKGAGASSLTNIAQEEFEKSLEVIHIRLTNTIYKPKVFLALLAENLKEKDIVGFDELIEKINNHPTKRVIIIENIEDLFLRIVNGFDVIKMFAQIISLTNNNIFWIATCNKYAWNYLSKVIDVDDYFAFIIRFNKFSNEKIKEIIMTRHSMSGYKLKFIPGIDDLDDKQFQKLNKLEQQEFLTDIYFDELNKISQSNVALAQLFWLRSIQELADNEIHISSLHNIDFSFLKNLNKQKVFSLAALLIHDGLTVEEHAIVFNMTNEESRLLLSAMLDDGELRLIDKNYRINFLLYVHVIKLLKSQNILH